MCIFERTFEFDDEGSADLAEGDCPGDALGTDGTEFVAAAPCGDYLGENFVGRLERGLVAGSKQKKHDEKISKSHKVHGSSGTGQVAKRVEWRRAR